MMDSCIWCFGTANAKLNRAKETSLVANGMFTLIGRPPGTASHPSIFPKIIRPKPSNKVTRC